MLQNSFQRMIQYNIHTIIDLRVGNPGTSRHPNRRRAQYKTNFNKLQ